MEEQASGNPLTIWLALELRRARAAFDKSRKEQDAYFEDIKVRKTGVRVTKTLKSASEICVALADATITKAADFDSSPIEIEEARKSVLAFTKEVVNSAIPLAHFVSSETGPGGRIVKLTIERGQQLSVDVGGAFDLAKMANREVAFQARDLQSLLTTLQEQAAYNWERERDRINSEFARAGRVQCHYHIKALAESAGLVVSDLLDEVLLVTTPPRDELSVVEFVSSVFETFAEEILEIAVAAAGRRPQPDNADVAKPFIAKALKRIDSKVILWKLGAVVKAGNKSAPPKRSMMTVKNSAGRPKGSGAMNDMVHLMEMRRLILQNPSLTPRDAAKIVEPKASGPNSTPESTVRRLRTKYIEKHVGK